MAAEWAEYLFPDIIDFQEGPGILAKDFREHGVPLVRLAGLERGASVLAGCNYLDPEMVATRWSHFGLAKGDILLSTSASLGRIAIVGAEGVGSVAYTGIIRMRPRDHRLVPSFIRYLLEAPDFQRQAETVGAGSVIRHFGPMHLREMTVKIPPPEEQRAIAHILGTLDDKIELNRRMSETLEAIARTLFKSWFVAFDPVHEKVGGSQTRRSSSDVLRLFPDSFEQSGGRQIPSGWTCAPLSHWVKAISGGTPAKDDSTLWGGDIPWISPKAMDWVHADETDHYVVEAAIGNGTQTAPPGATLVMVRGMGLHEKVRVSQTRGRVAFNQDVKALVGSGIEPVLLFFALLDAQQNLLERVESAGHGTGKLPTEILLSHPITMPTVAIQRQLARVLDALNDRMASARSQSRTLATLRDALLPRLVSGELRVNQGEQIVATEARV